MSDLNFIATGGSVPPSPPKLYNMGGPNPHQVKFWAGLDALTLNFNVEWDLWKFDRIGEGEKDDLKRCAARIGLELSAGVRRGEYIGDVFEEYHEKAQNTGEHVELPNGLGRIHPGGGKIGGVKYCKFKIELPECVLLIADQKKYSGDWPNVKVEISGERCLVYPGGAVEAYRAARRILSRLGASIHCERVSRADFCADFPGFGMDVFDLHYRRRRWTCRANRHHPDTSNGKSIYFGSGAIMLRIYDKLAEMQASALRGQPAKYQHMIEKRWNGVEPERAIRVEYQCRREWLKQYGVTDFDSLMWYARDLIGYLTGVDGTARWFRFLCRKPNDKHPELNVTMPEWSFVQKVMLEQFSKPEPLVKIDPDKADIETLLKQAFGVLECAAANRGFFLPWKETTAPAKYEFPDYEAFQKWFVVMLRSVAIQKPEWKKQMKNEPDAVLPVDPAYEIWLKEWEIKQKGNA